MSLREWHVDVGAVTMRGHRNSDEDALIVLAGIPSHGNHRIQALFDGHGGDQVSRFLASNLQSTLAEFADLSKPTLGYLGVALDDKIRREGIGHAGSTGVIVIIESVQTPRTVLTRGREVVDTPDARTLRQDHRGDRLPLETTELGSVQAPFLVTVLNTGDSRAMLVTNSDYFEMTKDHSPLDPQEKRRIEQAGYSVTNDHGVARIQHTVAMSRAYGDLSLKVRASGKPSAMIPDPDIRQFYASYGDTVVLFCDGVTEPLTVDWPNVAAGVRRLFSNGNNPTAVAAGLADMAFEEGSGDNISVIVTQFHGEHPSKPTATLRACAVVQGSSHTSREENCSDRFDTLTNSFYVPLF
ncbi:protein phosphatase 2C domain-containing protein [Besnoitia besnoiti]|uniref:Protein phosphatase 2C domain-containing protein n=1 Tax=Besnoitia besnoiti TaxID=94643 RepID=A0A2A9M065_BESBE|nr:protein phosphatase 2C domain-containing protein [Besnoitia besnoiti]PFH31339.1 protein phosphatase 2C domain-containing protein [Besnoitia besnoiti]